MSHPEIITTVIVFAGLLGVILGTLLRIATYLKWIEQNGRKGKS